MKKIQVLLAVGLVFGMGFVAHAGPTDVIHGCIKPRNQVLRIAMNCSTNEQPITWDQEGPVGPAGPASRFAMISGSLDMATSDAYGAEIVACPDGLVVLAASVWFEDHWGELLWAHPVRISDDGQFQSSVKIDLHLWWDPEYVIVWDVTCGAV